MTKVTCYLPVATMNGLTMLLRLLIAAKWNKIWPFYLGFSGKENAKAYSQNTMCLAQCLSNFLLTAYILALNYRQWLKVPTSQVNIYSQELRNLILN